MKNYRALARSYNTIQLENDLRSVLNSLYKSNEFESFSKRELHQKINNLLMRYSNGEEVLKYYVAKYFKNKDYIAAFEVKALNSRLDFLAINGNTKAYEIKSKVDTLNRLDDQINDYKEVFEYNTIITDKSFVEKLIVELPDFYGIWCFDKSKRIIVRDAKMSPFLNPKAQLGLFTKKELIESFETSNLNSILKEFNEKTINESLKSTLKLRYANRWNYLKENWNDIFPIDLQFFFNRNIEPEIIYNY